MLPRIQPPPALARPAVTQVSSYEAQSMTQAAHNQKAQAQRQAVAQAWTKEYSKSYDAYQAKLQAEAQAQAEAARIAALTNHPPPRRDTATATHNASTPLRNRAL